MDELEIGLGGNRIKETPSKAVKHLPKNRSLLVTHLTGDDPVVPESVMGLNDIDAVFKHFKPHVDISFTDEEGQPVLENFKFDSVGDFHVRQLTQQSAFLRNLSEQKDFYEVLAKQLRTNKVLQKVLENAQSKAAFIAALQSLKNELEATQH